AALRLAGGGAPRRLALRLAVLRATAGDRAGLAAGRLGGALLDPAAAAAVPEHRLGLLRGAAHVLAAAGGAGAVAVDRDRRARVRDVGPVGLRRRVAAGGRRRGQGPEGGGAQRRS